jgi:DNA-binding IclR family transcriptional regulator
MTLDEITYRWAISKGMEYRLEGHARLVLAELAQSGSFSQPATLPAFRKLSEDTGLPVQEVRRHVETLFSVGILEQTGLGTYRLMT